MQRLLEGVYAFYIGTAKWAIWNSRSGHTLLMNWQLQQEKCSRLSASNYLVEDHGVPFAAIWLPYVPWLPSTANTVMWSFSLFSFVKRLLSEIPIDLNWVICTLQQLQHDYITAPLRNPRQKHWWLYKHTYKKKSFEAFWSFTNKKLCFWSYEMISTGSSSTHEREKTQPNGQRTSTQTKKVIGWGTLKKKNISHSV